MPTLSFAQKIKCCLHLCVLVIRYGLTETERLVAQELYLEKQKHIRQKAIHRQLVTRMSDTPKEDNNELSCR